MATNRGKQTVRAVGRGVEDSAEATPVLRSPELDLLDVFVGRWINEGETITADGSPGQRIVTSDLYEWAPGRFHVVHSAYGLLAGNGGGGTEILTYDAGAGRFRTYFFDSLGNHTTHDLTVDGTSWRWQGESTRCTAELTEGGRVQTARHERSDDGGSTWVPSMTVVLTKVE
jgi:hypothetical protein